MNSDTVAILMSTYNGEKYLRPQIESLLNQTYRNTHLYVRDDMSTDSTPEILAEYAVKYPDWITIISNKGKNLGACKSFIRLLEDVDAEMYAFCDQDDVWLPFKIEDSVRRLKAEERKHPGKPIMVGTDLRIVEEDLSLRSESMWRTAKFNVNLRKRFNFCCVGNLFPGCVMLFNRKVKEICLPIPAALDIHDKWIWIMTAKHGIVATIDTPTILYRQHGNNTIGADDFDGKYREVTLADKLFGFYYSQKPLMDAAGYGGVGKAVFFKIIYLISIIPKFLIPNS